MSGELAMPRATFEDLSDEFEDVRDDYSGRGMYGEKCFALVGDVETFGDFLMYVTDNTDLDAAIFAHPTTDSMGYDTVYYWPHVTVA